MDVIIQNLKKQNSCYADLLDQIDQQIKAIAEQDDEGLLTTIDRKNELIQTLHRLEQDMRSAMEELGEDARVEIEERTQALRDGIVQSLEQLIAKEEACQQALVQRKDELETKLTDFKKKKSLFKGYSGPSPKGGGFSSNA